MFRTTKGGAASLRWRIGAFLLGAVTGLAGIFLDLRWLVTVALVVLLVGVVVRKGPARDSGSGEQEPKTPPR